MGVKFIGTLAGGSSALESIDRGCLVGHARFNSETPKSLSEALLFLAVDNRCGVVVPLHCPNPVVESVLKIAHAPVRIPQSPAGDKFLPHVCNIVPGRVLQEDCLLAVLNDHTAAITNNRCRDAKVRCENGKFVSDAVMVCVFANTDSVAALSSWLQFIWVVNGLAHP